MYGSNCSGYGHASPAIGYGAIGYGAGFSGGFSGSYASNVAGFLGGYAGFASYAGSGSANYGLNHSSQRGYQASESHTNFISEQFLLPERPWTPVIQNTSEIMPLVEKAFEHCTGTPFPKESISITVCTPEQFNSIHEQSGGWSSPEAEVLGFSFNRYGNGVSEIFVKQDNLDRLMLTIGHELGHVMSPTLPNPHDEESKAFAWSLAWMEAILEHNIGGLATAINPQPAKNGLHDVAFDFVKDLLKQGKKAIEVFNDLAKGLTSHLTRIETIILEV